MYDPTEKEMEIIRKRLTTTEGYDRIIQRWPEVSGYILGINPNKRPRVFKEAILLACDLLCDLRGLQRGEIRPDHPARKGKSPWQFIYFKNDVLSKSVCCKVIFNKPNPTYEYGPNNPLCAFRAQCLSDAARNDTGLSCEYCEVDKIEDLGSLVSVAGSSLEECSNPYKGGR